MKFRKNRRGFTIVELVIVIAVIGVLAAVLIPTFVSLTMRANKQADNMLVKNLNTALAMTENDIDAKDEEGNDLSGKNETMHDAVKDLHYQGFELATIAAKSTETILYDLDANEFLLSSKAVASKALSYWEIRKTTQGATYNVYAGIGFEETEISLTRGFGFDAGDIEGIASIEYKTDSANTVIIRSNGEGTSLVVEAPNGTVHHYDWLDKLHVKSVDAAHSYHEHGKVKVSAQCDDGHIVLEDGSDINEFVIPSNASENTSVDMGSGSNVGTLVIDNNNVEVNVENGAEVNQVVGDTSKIEGDGAAAAKENVSTKVYVSNKQELDEAIANEEADYIVLTADIDAVSRITIDRDLVLDGSSEKHTLSFSNEKSDNSRAINIGWDNENVKVALKNLVIVGPTKGGYTRGLNVGNAYTNLIVDNCEVSCKYYALNITGGCNGSVITITGGSKLTGWAAINLWSSIKVDVSDSELVGQCISKGEGFATICFEADTTAKTDMHVSDAKVSVKNSIIRTEFNYTDGDGYQAMVGYNYFNSDRSLAADHNTFECLNCDIQWAGPDDNLLLVYDYCAYGAQTNNVTIVNGKTLDLSSNWYVEK